MNFCVKCMSTRMAQVNAKCSDMCSVTVKSSSSVGYVPADMNIGGGDYLHFDFCMDCGHLYSEDNYPLPPCALEETNEQQGS